MKILIIRSAPMEQFKKVLKRVLHDHIGVEISVLTRTSSTSDVLDVYPARIYNYSGKKISLLTAGQDLLTALRKEEFDRVYLIFTNDFGQGYFQLRLFAQCLKPGGLFAFNRRGELIKVHFYKELLESLYDNVVLVGYAFIWFFLFVKLQLKKRVKRANRN